MTIHDYSQAFKNKQFTPVDALNDVLKRLESISWMNAVINVFSESASILAEKSAERYALGAPLSALDGVPFAVKDNTCVAGEKLTCASKALSGYVSPYSATSVGCLLAAGAIPVCSANMDEFGMGSTGENSAFGPVHHPDFPGRSPGGSSSGPAALVAAGCVPFALGSDTGGSVRQPASHCGIYGFKPSYGAISRYGLVSYSSSMDHIGILSTSADDIQTIFSILCATKDEKDSTSESSIFMKSQHESFSLNKCAAITNLFCMADEAVASVLDINIQKLTGFLRLSRDISMPDTDFIAPAYYIIACAEASSNLGRFDGIRYGIRNGMQSTLGQMYTQNRALLGNEVQKRIKMGAFILHQDHYATYYMRACMFREKLSGWFDEIFKSVDVLFLPTSPSPAPLLGASDAGRLYAADQLTACANLAGIPSICVPAGTTNGLPVGLQLMSARGTDTALINFAQLLSKEGEHHA